MARLKGLNPLSYRGVNAPQPPDVIVNNREPRPTDKAYTIGTIWVVHMHDAENNESPQIWVLVSLRLKLATWVNIWPSQNGGVTKIVCDVGEANQAANAISIVGDGTNTVTAGVGNDVITGSLGIVPLFYQTDGDFVIAQNGILNVVGDNDITTTGVGDTLTVSEGGGTASDFVTDSGTATPAANELDIAGGILIDTEGAGNDVIINVTDSVMTRPDLILGSGGATNAAWNPLISSDNSIDISYELDGDGNPYADLSLATGPREDGAFGGHLFLAQLAQNSTRNVGDGGVGWYFDNNTSAVVKKYSAINIISNEGGHWQAPNSTFRGGYYLVPFDGFYRVVARLKISYTNSSTFGSIGPPFVWILVNSGTPFSGGPRFQQYKLFYNMKTQTLTLDRLGYFSAGSGIILYIDPSTAGGLYNFFAGRDSFLSIFYVAM